MEVQVGTLLIAGTGTNAGHITVDAPATLDLRGNYVLTGDSVVDGAGLVSFSGGSIQLGGSVAAGGGILIGPNAVVSGTGVLTGLVVNAGTLNIGSGATIVTVTIQGDYLQTASGVLGIAIGGPNAGTDFDQLVVSGSATLDGTLAILLVNGFTPASGSTYSVLTSASETGTFATLSGDGTLFTAAYGPSGVTLTAN